MLDKRTEENRDEKRFKHEDKKTSIEEEERQYEEEMEIMEEDPPEHETTKEINGQKESEENNHKKDKYKKEIYVLKEGKLVREEPPLRDTQGRIVNKVENKRIDISKIPRVNAI